MNRLDMGVTQDDLKFKRLTLKAVGRNDLRKTIIEAVKPAKRFVKKVQEEPLRK